jgi:hypothetical protein
MVTAMVVDKPTAMRPAQFAMAAVKGRKNTALDAACNRNLFNLITLMCKYLLRPAFGLVDPGRRRAGASLVPIYTRKAHAIFNIRLIILIKKRAVKQIIGGCLVGSGGPGPKGPNLKAGQQSANLQICYAISGYKGPFSSGKSERHGRMVEKTPLLHIRPARLESGASKGGSPAICPSNRGG